MKQLQFRMPRYIFRPTLVGTLITLICIPLFIKLGLWQYHKAQQKQAIHAAYDQANVNEALQFPLGIINGKSVNGDLRYRKVTVRGIYEEKYQILLDNQVEGDRVGYHVITPLKIDKTSEYVLVNRGWILGKDLHTDVPAFATPSGMQTIIGQIWVPSKKIFTLESKGDEFAVTTNAISQPWQVVWQNMDIVKYKHKVPLTLSELAIKLDKNSLAGGFVRNWQIPADRIASNLGYAYQWFGFALAALLIFIYVSTTKIRPENIHAKV